MRELMGEVRERLSAGTSGPGLTLRYFREMVRLREALDPLGVPADVVVVTPEHVQEWGEVRSTMLFEALTEGRVLVET